MTEEAWKVFLTDFSRELLANERICRNLPPEVVAAGWLGYPPAAEEEIVAAEKRLGTALPPSFRAFLRVSNGWRNANAFIDALWPCAKIAWFRERNQEWIDAYVEPAREVPMPLSDEEYLVYGEAQDTVRFRAEYLPTALEISDRGDDAILLLNPETKTPGGEWEAWMFANWFPGARRYRSFRELMEEEREGFRELMENERRKRASPPSKAAIRKTPKPWWRFW